jgi:hypothetical protein
VKSLTLDSLLMLEEAQIREAFPFGAVCNRNGKWKPCQEGEEATKSLKELLAEKKKRQEKPRLLHRDSSRGYTNIPSQAMRGEPEAIPETTQNRYAEEAMERFNLTHEVVERAEKILYLRRRQQKKSFRSVRKAA